MYAIIEDRSKQYKVTEGQILDIDLKDLPDDAESVEFDRVLLVGEGADAKVGQPTVEGAKVVASIQNPEMKGPKIDVVNFIRRKRNLTHTGHRQKYTRVKIEQIVA